MLNSTSGSRRFFSRWQCAAQKIASETKDPAEPTEAQIKHLEFIQSVITRLATNSFLAKGWALTVAGALYGFSVSHLNPWIALIGIAPAVAFWWLDAYFLRAERLFRCLYDEARKPGSSVEIFSMNISEYHKDSYCTWRKVMLSPTLRIFYGTILILGLIIFAVSIIHQSIPAHATRTEAAVSSSRVSGHERTTAGQISPIASSCQRGTT
jgi:hypothetical protein